MKGNNVCISVIVAVYNVSHYVDRCIKSLISQTYKNLDIVIVDDGSTDESYEICRRYEMIDKRIKVYSKANGGLVSARKYGLQYSCGDYIAFVDGDDYLECSMYEMLLQNVLDSDADIVHSGYIEEDIDGNYTNFVNEYDETIVNLEDEKQKCDFLREYVLKIDSECIVSPSIWSKLMRRNVAEQYLKINNNSQYGEDLLFLILAIAFSKKIELIRDCKYHYVIRSESMSHKNVHITYKNRLKLMGDLLEMVYKYCYMQQLIDIVEKYTCYNLVVLSDSLRPKHTIQRYFFSNIEELFRKRIVIYAAGVVGQDYYAQFSKYKSIKIVSWIDEKSNNIDIDYAEVYGVNTIKSLDYDRVIVAVLDKKVATNIIELLRANGVASNKIIWKAPSML